MALVGVAGSILGVRAAFKESRAPISALDTLVSVGSRIRRSAAAGVDAARRAPGRLMAEISCGDAGYSVFIRRMMDWEQRCFLKGTKVLTESGRKNIEDIKVGDKVLSRNEQTGEQGYKRVSRLFRGETDTVVHLKIARKAAGKAAKKTAAKTRVGKPAKAASRRTAREPALARTRVRGRTQRRATAKRGAAKAGSTDDGDGSGYDVGHDDDTDSSDDGEDPDDADPSSATESSPALLSPDASLEAGAEIRCTPEHPFFVRGQGWVGADKLRVGDELVGDQGETLVVVEKEIRQEQAQHFNFEVEDWHTYFVAEMEMDPGVWVHNKCDLDDIVDDPSLLDSDKPLLDYVFRGTSVGNHGARGGLVPYSASPDPLIATAFARVAHQYNTGVVLLIPSSAYRGRIGKGNTTTAGLRLLEREVSVLADQAALWDSARKLHIEDAEDILRGMGFFPKRHRRVEDLGFWLNSPEARAMALDDSAEFAKRAIAELARE